MVASRTLMRAYREWHDAAGGYETAEAYARAQVTEDYASRAIMRMFYKAKVNTIDGFAYSAIPIRVISSRLKLVKPTVTLSDSDTPAERASAVLDQVMEANELETEIESLWRSVSKFGDAYLFVWPVAETVSEPDGEGSGPADEFDDEPESDEDDDVPVLKTFDAVEVLVNDPTTTRAIYDPENHLKIKYVVKTWIDEETDAIRVNLYFDDHVEKWLCRRGARADNPTAWERHPQWPEDIPTPLGAMPWFHFRNDRPYGVPEHAATYGPQRLINKLVSSLAAVIDYQVGPQRYYMADPTIDDPHSNLTDPDYPEDDDDDPEDPENTSTLDGDPRSVWKLYGRSAGQFEPANPDNIIRPLERAIQSMSELSGLPRFYFGMGTGETPSGAALRTLDAPTVEIVESRKRGYATPLRRALEYTLLLLGHDNVKVQIRWAPTTVVTDLEGWQIVAAKVAAGVPTDVALQEAGYLPEQVGEWLGEARGTVLTQRLAMLQQAATIVQAVSASAAPAPEPAPVVRPPTSPVETSATEEGGQAGPGTPTSELRPAPVPVVVPVPKPVAPAKPSPAVDAVLKAVQVLIGQIMSESEGE